MRSGNGNQCKSRSSVVTWSSLLTYDTWSHVWWISSSPACHCGKRPHFSTELISTGKCSLHDLIITENFHASSYSTIHVPIVGLVFTSSRNTSDPPKTPTWSPTLSSAHGSIILANAVLYNVVSSKNINRLERIQNAWARCVVDSKLHRGSNAVL